jgi:hypothetical protein
MKKYSTPSAIKTTLRFHLTPDRMFQENKTIAGCWWLIPIILVAWEVERGRFKALGPSGVTRPHLQNNQSKTDWRGGLSRRAPTL